MLIYTKTRRKQRRTEAIQQLGGRCVRCGSTDNLEFDHIDPNDKSRDICDIWTLGEKLLVEELQRCQLLCSPCHRKKTIEDNYESGRYPRREHGTLTMHRRGKCRCDLCREAFNKYRRDLRNRRSSN